VGVYRNVQHYRDYTDGWYSIKSYTADCELTVS
jgi:hypothetical protein